MQLTKKKRITQHKNNAIKNVYQKCILLLTNVTSNLDPLYRYPTSDPNLCLAGSVGIQNGVVPDWYIRPDPSLQNIIFLIIY